MKLMFDIYKWRNFDDLLLFANRQVYCRAIILITDSHMHTHITRTTLVLDYSDLHVVNIIELGYC